MFCGHCGTENENGAKFCKKCGQPLEGGEQVVNESASSSAVEANEQGAGGTGEDAQPVTETKTGGLGIKLPANISKKAVIGGCAAVAIILILVLVLTSKPTIKLDDYLTIEASGYDGYGTASAEIDWDAIEQKYGDKIKFTKKATDEFGGLLSMMTPVDGINEEVSVKLDKTKGLSNGDTVKYTWKVDEALYDYVTCKVKYNDGTYTISGLEAIGSFDPFADLEVTFSGKSPNGSLEMEYTGSELKKYDFSTENTYNLKNGDVVTIKIQDHEASYYADKFGKVPSVTEKSYTVEGLDEYVLSYADMDTAFIDSLKSDAEDRIYAYSADYDKGTSLKDLQYVGYVFESIKEGDSIWTATHNDVYTIYKGMLSNSENKFPASTVYYPVRYSNILKSGSEINYEDSNGIVGRSDIGGTWYSTKGYVNPLKCYSDIVAANKDSYNVECGDGFEIYDANEEIADLDDIGQEFKDTLIAEAEDQIESYLAERSKEDFESRNLALWGEYLLLNKNQGTDYEKNNKYILIFTSTISNEKKKIDPLTVYYPVEYDGIVKLAGEEYIISASKGIQGNSSIPDTWYSTKGYVDDDEMYTKIVTANRDNYTSKESDKLRGTGTSDDDDGDDDSGDESGQIFPDSSEKEISAGDIKDLSDDDLRYAINELYARHGYIFKDKDMNDYYSKFDWYEPEVDANSFSLDRFNKTEAKNVQNLQKERDNRK